MNRLWNPGAIARMTAALMAAALTNAGAALADDAAPRPDDHAPAGVMFDHLHDAGEVMIGYRYSYEQAGPGLRRGGRAVADIDVPDAACGGPNPSPDHPPACTMTASDMRMHMHMLDLMWAPTDRVTLMLMPMWMSHDMDMRALERPAGSPAGGHDDHGHAGSHSHGTEGLGDTLFGALIGLSDAPSGRAHLGVMLSAPTGAVDEKGAEGRFTHYHMQLGSGTWDFLPSLTVTGSAGRWSWGGQALGVIRLEDENESGYRLGDALHMTAWGAYRLTPWISASARLAHTDQGAIEGHYNGPHDHSAPIDLQPNYGGDFLDAGIGLNLVIPRGPLAGHRLSAEWLEPVEDRPNGYQLEQDGALYLSWSKAL